MKYKFCLTYELDTTVAAAVAAYLDAEHYRYLHKRYSPEYVVLSDYGRTTRVRQAWKFSGYYVGQEYTAEYIPPARFINGDVKPCPMWLPSIHHVVKVRTDLRYYPDKTGQKTVSHLEVEIGMPAWLYPFRTFIQRKLEGLKIAKDREDMEMIERRARLFGRGNIKAYLSPHQFLLHKDDFVKHFGP